MVGETSCYNLRMTVDELRTDLHIAEAGRLMMAQQVPEILEYWAIISRQAEVTAVHEMRKAVRRTFTSFVMFGVYFEPETIRQYKKGLRRIMRRLGRSRDLAVVRMKLAEYNSSAAGSLNALEEYWQELQNEIDTDLTGYLASEKRQKFLQRYVDFTQSPGEGVLKQKDPRRPVKTAHLAPVLIFQRVAAVRAFDDKLVNPAIAQLHSLRIQFKELRYGLQFFVPILGEPIEDVLASLKDSQEHLGNLNDARVALDLLDKIEGLNEEVVHYRSIQETELQRLIKNYWPVWREFDQAKWRKNLAAAVAVC